MRRWLKGGCPSPGAVGWAVVWGDEATAGARVARGQLGTHRVDDKADGLQLGSVGPCPSPVLLHQGHQAGADGFVILYVVILLGETDLKLGVGPECVCGRSRSGWPCPSQGGQTSRPHARLLNGAQWHLMDLAPGPWAPGPGCAVSQWPITHSLPQFHPPTSPPM